MALKIMAASRLQAGAVKNREQEWKEQIRELEGQLAEVRARKPGDNGYERKEARIKMINDHIANAKKEIERLHHTASTVVHADRERFADLEYNNGKTDPKDAKKEEHEKDMGLIDKLREQIKTKTAELKDKEGPAKDAAVRLIDGLKKRANELWKKWDFANKPLYKLESNSRLVAAEKWSREVTDNEKHHTPEGLFSKSAEAIAKELKKEHGSNFKSAMSALNFYYNRKGGDDPKHDAAVKALRKAYGREEE